MIFRIAEKSRGWAAAGFLFTLIVILFTCSLDVPLFVSEDGHDYLNYSSIIVSGDWGQLNEYNAGIMRSPLYPLLIAIFKIWLFDSVEVVRWLHLAIGLGTILLVSKLLRPWCHELITAFIMLFVLMIANVFFLSVLTEWSAICLLSALFCLLVRYFESPRACITFVITFLISCAILLRAAMLPMSILALGFLAMSIPRKKLRVTLATVLAGLTPVFALLVFNKNYLNVNGISPIGGVTLFGIASQIADPVLSVGLPEDLRIFVAEISAFKSQQRIVDRVSSYSNEEVQARRMWDFGGTIRAKYGWSYVDYGRIGLQYGWLVILQNPVKYLKTTIARWFSSARFLTDTDWALFFCWIVCLFKGAVNTQSRPVILASITMLFLHLLHTLFCSLLDPSFFRLVATTLIPFQFSMYIVCMLTVLGRSSKLGMIPNELNMPILNK